MFCQPPLRRAVRLWPAPTAPWTQQQAAGPASAPGGMDRSIPDAHPGYITLDTFELNQKLLAANAQAHGADRTTGPAREDPPCYKDWPYAGGADAA